MKHKVILGILLLLLPVFQLAANEKPQPSQIEVMFRDYSVSQDVETLVRRTVPNECQDAFLYFTKSDTWAKTKQLRILLLAIGQHESGWRVTRGALNKNGTRDWGYLMLNDVNIKSKQFNKTFGPTAEYLETKEGVALTRNERYLILCINYFKYLYDQYGEDALYCYNAGERRYLRKTLPESTLKYKPMVLKEYTKYERSLRTIERERYGEEFRLAREQQARFDRLAELGKIKHVVEGPDGKDRRFSKSISDRRPLLALFVDRIDYYSELCTNVFDDKTNWIFMFKRRTDIVQGTHYEAFGYENKKGVLVIAA